MERVTIGIIGFLVLFILIAFRLPIGFALLLVGFTGIGFLSTMGVGVSTLSIVPYATASSYTFAVLPLFVLMGLICSETGLITEVYYTFYRWLGHLPGGLAITTIGGSAAFAATTGSSLAAAATMTRIALPEMLRYEYDPKFATGTIAAGGTLGILIPPSAILIVYGIITETSIGRLFIAGIIPGILLTLLFMCLIYVLAKVNPSLGLPGPKATWHERLTSVSGTWPVLALFVAVIGGIYIGFVTPTEAGAFGVFVAFLISLVKRRFTMRIFIDCLKDTMQTTGMVFVIIMGAFVFNRFMALSNMPMELADTVSSLRLAPHLIFAFVVIIFLFLGCIMDSMSMVVLTMPVFFPIIMNLGFDPIWFGIITVLVVEAGLITPPIGLNVYIVAGMAKDVPLFAVFRGVAPFLIAMIVCIIILTVFPQIATVLPNMMK